MQLTAEITALINDVYAVAEEGLWVEGTARTAVERVTGLIRAGEMAVARVDGQIVGCVRIQVLGDGIGEFGMLAVIPGLRGTGVGRDLVRLGAIEDSYPELAPLLATACDYVIYQKQLDPPMQNSIVGPALLP